MTDAAVFGGGQFFEKYLNDSDSKSIQLYSNDTSLTTAQNLYDSQTLAVYTVPVGRRLILLWYSVSAISATRYLRASDNSCTMWVGDGADDATSEPIYLEFSAGVNVEWRGFGGVAVHVLGVETTT